MNLDYDTDFNAAVTAALLLGISHVASDAKKLPTEKVVAAVGAMLNSGTVHHRRFHETILSRAYGLAFINKTKMDYAARLEGGAL